MERMRERDARPPDRRDDPGPFDEAPPGLLGGRRRRVDQDRRTLIVRYALGGLFLMLILAIFNSSMNEPPELAGSCTDPTFALNTATPRQGQTLSYAVTGPPGARFALAIDTAALVRQPDGSLQSVAAAGFEDEVRVVGKAITLGDSCRADGAFGVPVDPGRHAVTMFRLTDTGSEQVRTENITVTAG